MLASQFEAASLNIGIPAFATKVMNSKTRFLAYTFLLSIALGSSALAMKAGSAAASGKAPSLLFVTNKMCPFAQKVSNK
jgi:hypothetical protein